MHLSFVCHLFFTEFAVVVVVSVKCNVIIVKKGENSVL